MSEASVLRFSGFRRAASDLERSVDFYVHALGFEVDQDRHAEAPRNDAGAPRDAPTRCVHLKLGGESIELFAPVGYERHPGADVSADAAFDPAFHHLAIVTSDMDAAWRRLSRYSPTAISSDGPVRLPKGAGGVTAFKFRDPDGHPLEMIFFPPGVGQARWQKPLAGPTLGIDHSAITVSNVEQSLSFYVDTLGFRTTSRQTNRGAEQARLDGACGVEVVVEVVGLAPSRVATPHLELLGYVVPAPPRAHLLPALDADHADRMTFVVDDLSAIIYRLDAAPGAAAIERLPIDAQTLLMRDNDGHLLRLVQQDLPSPS